MDLRQSKAYANYLASTGWVVENINGIFYFIRKLPLIGNFIKIQRPKNIDLNTIEKLIKKYHVFQILIEPKEVDHYQILIDKGFNVTSPYLPSKTLILNLNNPQASILKNMRKSIRYSINNTHASLIFNPELSDFRKSWKKAVGLQRYVPSLKNLHALKSSFGTNSLFLKDQNTCSGAIILLGAKTAYYFQAFTDKNGRRNSSQYQIVWQGIKWAKNNKAKAFDFEGIYDTRFPNRRWAGFTFFKKGFGGEVFSYPPSLKKYYWKNIIK